MVSTHSKAGVNKQADAGPSGTAGITPELAAILALGERSKLIPP